MNKPEAQKILAKQLARFGTYTELVPFVESSHVEHCEIHGASGTKYQVELQFFWDDKPGGVVRVSGSRRSYSRPAALALHWPARSP